MSMLADPTSGLLLPRQFVDEKQSLKKVIDEMVDQAVYANKNVRENFFLTLKAQFNKFDPSKFEITPPIVTFRLPPFTANTLVFWVSNKKGICELLWMVSRGADKKLKVEFNQSGVAYLQAKGAMPSKA
jgi:hypothetical protein